MNSLRGNADRKSFWRIALRALVSTGVIGAVALVVISLRAGSWRWQEFKAVLAGNWTMGVMIFFALVIWDGWFERSRRSSPNRRD